MQFTLMPPPGPQHPAPCSSARSLTDVPQSVRAHVLKQEIAELKEERSFSMYPHTIWAKGQQNRTSVKHEQLRRLEKPHAPTLGMVASPWARDRRSEYRAVYRVRQPIQKTLHQRTPAVLLHAKSSPTKIVEIAWTASNFVLSRRLFVVLSDLALPAGFKRLCLPTSSP